MPLLGLPLALIGLTALPALAAIYWLRNRFRRHPVSSLMLWVDQRSPREGGMRVQRLATPLLFFLELLVLAALVIAAAEPRVLASASGSPLMIVLDDSYSMRAEDEAGRSARQRGLALARDALEREGRFEARLILAGPRPQVLGPTLRTPADAEAPLERWQPSAGGAALAEAISFAAELGGERARILLITDQAPPEDLQTGRVRWRAVGEPRANFAIVNAVRVPAEAGDRVLIEVRNLSDDPGETTLTLALAGGAEPLRRETLALAGGETRRIRLNLAPDAGELRAALDDDALDIDNTATLLPTVQRPVRVGLRIGHEPARRAVQRALTATGRAELVARDPQLLIVDRDAPGTTAMPPGEAWLVQLLVEPDDAVQSYVGPFVLDRTHPLAEGLSLAGVVWTAGSGDPAGLPVISAGNTPLLTDELEPDDRHRLRLRLRPELSTLPETINWPALWWNLLRWRAAEAPGLDRRNVRVGEPVTLHVADGVEQVIVTDPAGVSRQQAVNNRRLTLEPDRVGRWELIAGERTHTLAVNTQSTGESDLRGVTTGAWGRWLDDPTIRRHYADVSWVLLLAALGLLTLHGALLHRSSRAGGPPA